MNVKPPHVRAREAAACRRRRLACCALAALLLASTAGCGAPHLDTYYGRDQIGGMSASVNGTDVLQAMFEARGHKVVTRRSLVTKRMESVDTIVWFPDDYAVPREEVCEWFDDWLYERPGRTLIYVGRSFDAAPIYWRTVGAWVTPEQAAEYRRRGREAELEADPPAAPEPESLDCQWFRFEPKAARDVTALSGSWSDGVSASGAEIKLRWRILPHDQASQPLVSGDDVLVARIKRLHWPESQLLVVANGSFLLNLPLVNHEHRKLAGKLIDAVPPDGTVVFLQSGKGGPPIDPPPSDLSMWRLFGAWPLNVILLHFGALGVIFCFARWPIFGRPRVPPLGSLADFGKHVAAVGQLLRRTRDRNYAAERLATGEDAPARPGLASESTTASPQARQNL